MKKIYSKHFEMLTSHAQPTTHTTYYSLTGSVPPNTLEQVVEKTAPTLIWPE
jgi:hypothetical protein